MSANSALVLTRRWWWLLLVCAVVGGGIAYGAATLVTPTYRASATLLVVQQQDPNSIGLSDLQASERLANTFARLVTVRPVLEAAITRGEFSLSPSELRGRITVTRPAATQLLVVTAEASQADAASDLANAVAGAFIESSQSDLANRSGLVSVVEHALVPSAPSAPNKPMIAILAATISLIAAAGLVILVEYLDDTVKDDDAVDRLTGLPVVGHVIQFGRPARPAEALRAAIEPRSREAEAYRSVRTNLTYSADSADEATIRLMVTSPAAGEGKSTTVANLAIVFGLAGSRVLVLDADLRRPSQHRYFGVPNAAGLSTLLAGDADPRSVVQRTAHENVWILSSGPLPAHPSELLGSPQTAELINKLSAHFDALIIDSPPALAVTDATLLARLVTTCIVVVQHGKTRNDELRLAVQRLAVAGKPIAGVVINRAREAQSHYYYARYEGRPAADRKTRQTAARQSAPGSKPVSGGVARDS